MSPPVGIYSEIGRLERVIVHRPGRELGRLTPHNKELMLFDELPWPEGAAEEHDALVHELGRRDVEVLYLQDLLVEVVAIPTARKEILSATCSERDLGRGLADLLAEYLDALPDAELVERLIAGVGMDELPGAHQAGLTGRFSQPGDFALTPLPNHLFMRDSSMWIRDRVHVASMAAPSRRRETVHMNAIYRHHPRFTGDTAREPTTEEPTAGPIEGGDVLAPSPGFLLIGIGARTTPAAVEQLARQVFADGHRAGAGPPVREVIAVDLPHERAVIHLDTVMTMVDRDLFTVFPPVVDALRAFRLTPDGGRLTVSEVPDLPGAMAGALGVERVRLVPTGGDRLDQQREQWSDANNVFAVAPGVVLAYDRNVATNQLLTDAGAEVITVPSSELGRGRGGPRCLTCPTSRRPA